jgi:hypothetical protein
MIRYTNRRKKQGLHVVIFYYKVLFQDSIGARVAAASQVRAFWEIIKCDVAVKFSGVTFILSSVKTSQLFQSSKWGGMRGQSHSHTHTTYCDLINLHSSVLERKLN